MLIKLDLGFHLCPLRYKRIVGVYKILLSPKIYGKVIALL